MTALSLLRTAELALEAPVEDGDVGRLRAALDVAEARVRELEAIADTDTLTPVTNRRAFARELARAVAMRERYGVPAALVFLDVDRLKAINDAHGHKAGDAALVHVARVLVDGVRSSDVVGRLGGDEFAIILFHANAEQARAKGRWLARAIAARAVRVDGTRFNVTAALGACSLEPGDDAEALLARADAAMYTEKRKRA